MVNLQIQLPDGFFKEEERCGHVVTSQMKEVWAIELDLLSEFQRVCKKYGIKYYANGGTMLGAARHQGFIPWDDDIDLMMYREEYDKLCSHAIEFKHPYFFQTEYTDKGSLRGHAQLRNTDTTGILNMEYKKKYKFNQGIFIDIFPMDNVPDDEIEYKQFVDRTRCLREKSYLYAGRSIRHSEYYNNSLDRFLHKVLFYPCLFMMDYWYKKYEHFCSKYINVLTKNSAILCVSNPTLITNDFYKTVCNLKFEFLEIPVPGDYNKALSEEFGDWRKLVKGKSTHGGVFFDTSKSYLEYLNTSY